MAVRISATHAIDHVINELTIKPSKSLPMKVIMFSLFICLLNTLKLITLQSKYNCRDIAVF